MNLRSELRRSLLSGSSAPKFELPEPPRDPWEDMSWWEKALDILSRPTYASAGIAKSLVTGQGNPLKEGWRGLTGEKRNTYSDVLAAAGMDKSFGRSALGFGLDVLLDPTTYLTFGAGAGEKVAVKGVEKTLTAGAEMARAATKLHLESRLLEVLPKLDEARRATLLERTGLSLAGKELPNEALAKVMSERLTNDALGRAAAGGAVPKTMAALKGLPEEQIFKPAALRFAGMPIVKGETLAAPVKAGYGLAKKIPVVGPAIQGAEDVIGKASAAVKKVFSTRSGLPEFDEIVTAARDKLDRDTFNVFERRSKQWIDPLKAIRKEGGDEAYQGALKEIRTYLEGTTQIKKTPLFDATKLAEVDQHIAKLTEHLEATKKLHGESAARRGEQAGRIGQLIQGAEEKLGKLGGSSNVEEIKKFFGAAETATPGPARGVGREAELLSKKLAKDENRMRGAARSGDLDLAKEFSSRGIAPNTSGVKGEEYAANIPRHFRKKAGVPVDEFIQELSRRGALPHNATEEDFYSLLRRVTSKPKKTLPEDMLELAQGQVASENAWKAKKLEDRIKALKAKQAELTGGAGGSLVWHHTNEGVSKFADKPTYFTTRKGGWEGAQTVPAMVNMKRPLKFTEAVRNPDVLEAIYRKHGVLDENAKWQIEKLRHDNPDAFFGFNDKSFEPQVNALRKEGFDGAILDSGLVQGDKWHIPFSSEGVKKVPASPLLEGQVKKLEGELAEKQTLRKQIPTIMRETPETIRVAPTDPRAAAVAESMRTTFEDIWKAEKQHLALPPEKMDFYFPHYMRDEVRSMLVDVMRMDARKVLKPERSAALSEAMRRTTYGTVDEVTIGHLIDSGALDASKVREELAARGVHLSTDDMLVFEENPVVAAVKRELNHVRSMVHTEFARQVLESPYFLKGKVSFSDVYKIRQTLGQHPGHVLLVPTKEYVEKFVTPQMRAEMQAGRHKEIVQSLFQEVNIRDLDRLAKDEVLKNAQAYIIPHEVAEHLARAYTLQFNEKEIKAAFQMWDKMTGWWKAFATVWRPGFHTRNAFSNFWNMFIGGWRDPKSMFEAGMVLTKPEAVGRIAGYSGKEILALADAYGVRKAGFIGADVSEAIERVVTPSKNPLSVTGPVARFGSQVGSTIEDHARLTFFIDGLKQGMDPAAAAMRVKKYLFDYKDLTRVEKGFFRRMMPFYTWTRKNIPLQLEMLFTRPGYVSALEKVRTEAEKAQDDPLERKFVASWIRDGMGIPVRRTPDGKTEFFLMKGWIPTADLMSFGLDDVVSALHPAIKGPLEAISNRNFFTGRPLELFPGEKQEFLGVPMRGRLVHLIRNISFLSTLDRALSPSQSGETDMAAAALFGATGIKTYAQDKVVQMRSRVFELQDFLGKLQTAAAAATKKYGEDSAVALQYEAQIQDAKAERDRVKTDLLQIAPDAFKPTRTGMLDRLLKPKKERFVMPSIAGMRRRLTPSIASLLHPPKKKTQRGA